MSTLDVVALLWLFGPGLLVPLLAVRSRDGARRARVPAHRPGPARHRPPLVPAPRAVAATAPAASIRLRFEISPMRRPT